MLKPLQVSARLFSANQRQSYTTCREAAILGLTSQQPSAQRWDEGSRKRFGHVTRRQQSTAVALEPDQPQDDGRLALSFSKRAKKLPLVCPGCGAPSQTVDSESAGFYASKRLEKAHKGKQRQHEDDVFDQVLRSGALSTNALTLPTLTPSSAPDIPICDRCHYLTHQSRGSSIIHPSMQSIQDIIEESPHKQNHIYHILDAADFPLSLIPNLQHSLDLPRLRTQNRRSKHHQYLRGRIAEVSFIITRSDLLAPQKEQVDSLVPYLRDVLRDALGRSGKNVRLGNVRCVSAKRGWWTKTVKEDIWNRGGAGWMVGKVNVGKSALYEVVFPKGRGEVDANVRGMRDKEERTLEDGRAMLEAGEQEPGQDVEDETADTTFVDSPSELDEAQEASASKTDGVGTLEHPQHGLRNLELEEDDPEDDTLFDSSLLPPAQPETPYPHMPLVSSLPGTTASPIRIPFGNGKGELIDLPGIQRSSLDTYVKPEHRKELVMKSRVVPEQLTIKPGQSLLIGGMIRISPKTDDLIFLACPFVPLEAHVTSHAKATAIQTGLDEIGEPYAGTIESIATDSAKHAIKTAGTFKLEWDVTKRRAGPLTSKAAGKQKAANLPFTIYSADILIESVGWIELVCQVRNRNRPRSFETETVSDAFGEDVVKREVESVPKVELWSPEGKFVGVRRPMGAWLLGGPKKEAVHQRRGRPRQSISFARRKEGGAKGVRAMAE